MQYLVSNAHEIHVDSILHKACHHVLSIVANSEEEGINLCWPSFGQSLMSWVCPSVFKIKSDEKKKGRGGRVKERMGKRERESVPEKWISMYILRPALCILDASLMLYCRP